MPLLEPSDPNESKAMIPYAFDLSERCDIPVIVRLTTRVSHTKENVTIGARVAVAPKGFKPDSAKYVMVPRNAFLRHIDLEKRLVALKAEAESSPLNTIELNDTSLGIITSGVSYLYAKEVYPNASFLKLGFSYPFPEKLIRTFASHIKELVVIEELEPFLEEELSRLGLKCRAKHPSWRVGELRPEDMTAVVEGQARPVLDPTVSRKPVMCPGCPHRGVYSVIKKLKLTVTGDIGCYTLGALAPLNAIQTCLCMGAGVTMFEGFRKTLGKKVIGVIGDGTFVHSGITGLINAAYNLTHGVIVILDNSTTAMTGTQPHPGTGETAKGVPTKSLVLEDICKACGADNVDIVSAYDTAAIEKILTQRMEEETLTVIIARTPCKLIARAKKPQVQFNAEKCVKCYQCLNIGCPALSKGEDGLIKVDKDICVGCYVCAASCRFDSLTRPDSA
jgi:indolepyruvate ferredoxin oxidoreductase alpha subunit